jgi:hypothetical protein
MTDDDLTLALPDLQDTLLDAETLGRLFFDLGQLATILEVRLKGAALSHAQSLSPSLEHARTLLAAGSALGVQIRYQYGGSEWIDTLLRTQHGVRLVRMQAHRA